jgi:MOSC domain-containing protein YiiM
MIGHVEAIHITRAAGGPMEVLDEVEALVGRGLAGDRYLLGTGFYSDLPRPDGGREVTLIESEVLEAVAAELGIAFGAADSRRNLSTRGLRLPDLIGQRFAVGAVVCEGVDHCPPCQHLVDVTGQPVLKPLVDRSGIRARIVVGGWIRVGDTITAVEEPARY